MERIHCGWLTKSPPERKIVGVMKWFRSVSNFDRLFLSTVCVLSDISGVCFFVWLQISATVTPIGVKFFRMVGPTGRSGNGLFPFWGRCSQGIFGPKFCPFTANFSKTASRSDTCQIELNISSTGTF